MLIPYHVDVPMRRLPVMNWVIIGVTVIAFFYFPRQWLTADYVSQPWVIWGGHLLMHGDIVHLFGNMLFLWLFGNAICAKVGNLLYPVVYFLLGLAAMITHVAVDGRPGIGASGALNGIVGMFVVWYLLNEISTTQQPRVFAAATAMAENIVAGVAGFFEGVGENRQLGEAALVVDGLSEYGHVGCEPGGIDMDGAEGVAENAAEEVSLIGTFGVCGGYPRR